MSYSEKVIEHYNNPRNVGSLPKDDATVGTGLVGAPECGDVMKLQIKVGPDGIIEDAKFKTYGCGSAIASSSLVTEWVKGKTLDQAMDIKNTQIAEELALPPVKIHCSILAEDAIKAAIADYRTKHGPAADKSSTVTATAQDSIGCAVTYRWTAPTGTLANPAERETLWTAPMQEGTVPVTVTATCPDDQKTASDSVNIQVTRPPVKTYTFEDVHFDFDRYSLRPEATRVLDEAIAAMKQDATLKLEIEGHTCNIGTAEYNLALGDRRANAVKNYLVTQGISADRLHTVSYGEERPKYDNAREETRRLNRRAALVVQLQR